MRKQGPKQMKTSLAWGAFLAVLLALACPAARSQFSPYPRDTANRPSSLPEDPGALGNYDPVVAARRFTPNARSRWSLTPISCSSSPRS